MCSGIVEIFAIGNFVRAERVDEGIFLALMLKRIRLDFRAAGKGLKSDGNLRGDIALETTVHQVKRCANGDGGDCHADEQAKLLKTRR